MPNPVRNPNVKPLNSKYTRGELLIKAGKYDFRTARRRRGPIYEVLIKELYDDGCTRLANMLQSMVDKEQQMYAQSEVVHLVRHKQEFLMQLYENFRTAELIKLNPKLHPDGLLHAVKLMYECTFLVEKFSHLFHWLLIYVYDNLATEMFKLKTKSRNVLEFIARFRYKYGKLLAKQGNYKKAVDVLLAAEDMCNAELWTPDTYPESIVCETLHEAIARKLGSACLIYAKKLHATNAAKGIRMADTALQALGQVGIKKNKELILRAYVAKIDFLIQMLQYDKALKENAIAENFIKNESSPEFLQIKCQLLMKKGICYYNSKDKIPKSLMALKRAFAMCIKYNFTSLESELLLLIGLVYASSTDGQYQANLSFEAAKRGFTKTNDNDSIRMVNYMIAKLQAKRLLPVLSQVIKSKRYCDFYHLRQWKNQCRPFWTARPSKIHVMNDTGGDFAARNTVNLYDLILEGVNLDDDDASIGEISVAGDAVMNSEGLMELTTEMSGEYSDEWEVECQEECEQVPSTASIIRQNSIYCLLQEH